MQLPREKQVSFDVRKRARARNSSYLPFNFNIYLLYIICIYAYCTVRKRVVAQLGKMHLVRSHKDVFTYLDRAIVTLIN